MSDEGCSSHPSPRHDPPVGAQQDRPGKKRKDPIFRCSCMPGKLKKLRSVFPVKGVHVERLRRTPFGTFYEADAFNLQGPVVHEVVSRWTEQPVRGCSIAHDVVPFDPSDVALLSGLPLVGRAVTPQRGYRSQFVDTYFPKGNISEKDVFDAMQMVVNEDDAGSVADMVRLLILYIMVVLLFPNTGGSVKSWMCFYLEDLERVSSFAWGKYAYDFLVGHVSATAQKLDRMKQGETKITCLGGPAFILQAWLYEHTTRWLPTDAAAFPRYLRWCGKPTAPHDKGHTRRWVHYGFLSRFGNRISQEEVVHELVAAEEERALLSGDVQRERSQRKRRRLGEDAPADSLRTRRPVYGTRLSNILGKKSQSARRSPNLNKASPTVQALGKKVRRLKRQNTTTEARLGDLCLVVDVLKVTIGNLQEEATRWRDEAASYRDDAQRLCTEAAVAKEEAYRCRAEATAAREDARRYADECAAMKVEMEGARADFGRGGSPLSGDYHGSSSSDPSRWSENPLTEGEMPHSSSDEVEELPVLDVLPLATELALGQPSDPHDIPIKSDECGGDVLMGREHVGDGGTAPIGANLEAGGSDYRTSPDRAGPGPGPRRSTREKKKSTNVSSPYTMAHVRTRGKKKDGEPSLQDDASRATPVAPDDD